MSFESLRKIVDTKLAKLGIKLSYKLGRTKSESGTSRKTRTIYLNPLDAKYKDLARHDMQHLLMHETGHVLLYDVPLRVQKSPEFVLLFGDVVKAYRRKQGKVKTSPDFISNYAQVQPRDNFCEVFAVCCAFEGNLKATFRFLKQHKKSGKVKAQVLWLSRFLKTR